MTASALVTGGFVVLPVLLGLGFVVAQEWAGRHLGESPATRRRWVIGTGLGMAVWLLLTGAVAATGALRRFDVAPPPLAQVAQPRSGDIP